MSVHTNDALANTMSWVTCEPKSRMRILSGLVIAVSLCGLGWDFWFQVASVRFGRKFRLPEIWGLSAASLVGLTVAP